MPTYEFKNKVTGEIFEKVMKIPEKEQYLADNPDLESYFGSMNIADPVTLGITKLPGGFKEVLQGIHERTPGSKLNTITTRNF